MRKRLTWLLAGLLGGLIFFWLLGDLLGKHNVFALILGSVSGGNLALWIGQLTGKLKPPEAPRPVTLFPDNRQP